MRNSRGEANRDTCSRRCVNRHVWQSDDHGYVKWPCAEPSSSPWSVVLMLARTFVAGEESSCCCSVSNMAEARRKPKIATMALTTTIISKVKTSCRVPFLYSIQYRLGSSHDRPIVTEKRQKGKTCQLDLVCVFPIHIA